MNDKLSKYLKKEEAKKSHLIKKSLDNLTDWWEKEIFPNEWKQDKTRRDICVLFENIHSILFEYYHYYYFLIRLTKGKKREEKKMESTNEYGSDKWNDMS